MEIEIVSVKCRIQLELHQVTLLLSLMGLEPLIGPAGAAEPYIEVEERSLYFTAKSEADCQRVVATLKALFEAQEQSGEEPHSGAESDTQEMEPWQLGDAAVRERLPNAVVFYSFGELPDKRAVTGNAVFVAKHDSFYGPGADFRSEVVENPTYLDIALIADQAIRATGDYHHTFIEAFSHLRDEDGPVQVFSLHFGS